jgi:hypothetical protein
MTEREELEALRLRHRRLRIAAEAVLAAASYPTAPEEQPRVYRGQLRDLERELAGEPQPNGLKFMGPT